jgi:hypothetical protein
MIIIVGNPPWTLAQRGVEVNEVGIAIRRFTVRYTPEINDRLQNNAGETIARAMSNDASREVTYEGETTGANGVMAFTFGSTCSFANDVADFGTGYGRLLLDEATVTQERAGWRSVSGRCSSNPLL